MAEDNMASAMTRGNTLKAEMLDMDLLEVVNDALHNLDSVRESGLALQINVLDEVVTVSGVVLSRIMRQMVLQTISRVPSVKRVKDRLFTDTDLAVTVSQALAVEPLTRNMYDIRVTSYRGQVTLVGRVANNDVIKAARTLTSDVLGVRAVVNRLTVAEKIE